MHPTINKHPHRSGMTLIWGLLSCMLTMFTVTFAVDWGRVQMAKVQLQSAVDAAARAAALSVAIDVTVARTNAIDLAAMNRVDGVPVALTAADIVPGRWDRATALFTANATPYNAVRINGHRTAQRGSPITLFFANMFGATSCDVNATAIAYCPAEDPDYAFVGVNSASFSGPLGLGLLAKVEGDLVSNGKVTVGGGPLSIGMQVDGDALSYTSNVQVTGLANVTGTTGTLSKTLDFPSVSVPSTHDNSQISTYLNSQNDFTAVAMTVVPAGKYVVRNFNILAGLNVRFEGPVTFYVTGNVTMLGNVNLFGATTFSPSNFRIRVAPGGNVLSLASAIAPMNVDLYAPDSDVTLGITALSQFNGRLVGKNLNLSLPALSKFVGDTSGRDINRVLCVH